MLEIHTLTIQAADPTTLAVFWMRMLDYEVQPNHTDSIQIGPHIGTGPVLLIAPGRRTSNQDTVFHLDLRPDDQGVEVAKALSLGARIVESTDSLSWVRMADPEGNSFCILQSHADFASFEEAEGRGKPTI